MKRQWDEAQARQAQAAEAGFDWPDLDGVFDKLREELGELAEAANVDDEVQRTRLCQHELGDLLFVVAHLTRRLGITPEVALDDALARFNARFAAVMEDAESLPPLGDPRRLDVMEARWQAAKKGGL